MTKPHLLLVERDAKTRRLLKVSLEQAGYQLSTARDGADALQKLELLTPALVLSATELPRLDGYALVRRMKENAEWARIPVIFMVAGESIEDKIRGLELGVEDYLSKPLFVKELLARVQVLLAKRVRRHLSTSGAATRVQGSLEDLPTIDLLESLESGRQSGSLRIRWGDRVGEVWFQDGEIIDARLKQLRGEEVVFRLLCWTEGTFEVNIQDLDAERIIESGTRALIEAGMRHAAEYNRLLGQLPGPDVVLEVDHAELAARMGDIPGELDGILRLLDGERTILDVIDDSPFDDISTLQTVAKLHTERMVRLVVGTKAKQMTIPGPPRTPTPPEADSEPPDDGDDGFQEDFDDQLPTMRPPDVIARKRQHRVARVVPPSSDFDEHTRKTVAFDAPESPLPVFRNEAAFLGGPAFPPPKPERDDDEEPAPPTPRRGGLEAQPAKARGEIAGAVAETDFEATMAVGTPQRLSGAAVSGGPLRGAAVSGGPLRGAAIGSDAPATPEGHRAPASIPPATDEIDAEFEKVLSAGRSLPSDPAKSSMPPMSEPAPESEPESEEPESEEPESDVESEPASAPTPTPKPVRTPPPRRPPQEPEEKSEWRIDPPTRPDAPSGSNGASDSPPAADLRLRSDRPSPSDRPLRSDRPALSSSPPVGPGDPPAAKRTPRQLSSDPPAKISITSDPPRSGPTELSESGVSEGFFATPPPGVEDIPEPVSESEPVYLTAEQVVRKRRSMRIMAMGLGVLIALTLFVLVRGRDDNTPVRPADSSAATTTTETPLTTSDTTAGVLTDDPPPPASASAAPAGAAGGDAAGGGAAAQGGAPPDEGIGGAAVASVEDPLKEAERLANIGRLQEVIPMAHAAARKNPKDGTPYFWLAIAYEGLGQRDKMKEAYTKCAELGADPRYNGSCAPYKPKPK